MNKRFANPETGELYPEGSVVDLSDGDEDVIYEEPTRVSLDDNGEEVKSYSMTRQALKGKSIIEKDALRACRRSSGCFLDTAERAEFRRITAPTIKNTPEGIVYKAWLYHNIEMFFKHNSSGAGSIWSFETMIKAMNNEGKRDEWIMKNRDRILSERKASVTHAREDEIFEG